MKKSPSSDNEFISDLSQKTYSLSQKVASHSISHSLLKFIQEEHPEFTEKCFLSMSELSSLRVDYIAQKLKGQLGELSSMEKLVIDTLSDGDEISNLALSPDSTPLSPGQKMADHVATFGGSWIFIMSFGFFLCVWIVLNTAFLLNKGFDPYPFTLLNLILSCIAALQAPIIMMSQNRQEEKDRERSKLDYMINLKSELEIRTLHEKLDHLIIHQQRDLFEIQEIQIEMMKDITHGMSSLNKQ